MRFYSYFFSFLLSFSLLFAQETPKINNQQAVQQLQKFKINNQVQSAQPVAVAPLANVELKCPLGNLVYQKKPIPPTRGIQRSLRMTDGYQVAEGSFWELDQTSILKGSHQMIIDLGINTSIKALTLQADNNDSYHVYGSLDQKNYFPIWEAKPIVSQTG